MAGSIWPYISGTYYVATTTSSTDPEGHSFRSCPKAGFQHEAHQDSKAGNFSGDQGKSYKALIVG